MEHNILLKTMPLMGNTVRKILQVDKRPFFPIGLYSVPHTGDFAEISACGFNLVHSYEHERALFVNYQAPKRSTFESAGDDDKTIRDYLRAAEKHGLKVMLGFDRMSQLKRQVGPLGEEEKQGIAKRVRAFSGESALLGWYLLDEPDASDIPPAKCHEVHEYVNGLDQLRPTITVLCDPSKAERYSSIADVIMHDNYPIPQSSIIKLGEAFGRYDTFTSGQRILWAAPQVFNWRSYDQTRLDGRFPTQAEVRCMTYLSIVQGATGVVFFCYDNEVHNISKSHDPEHWEELAQLAGELRTLTPVFVSSTPVNGLAHTEGIAAWARAVGNDHWVIAVNPTSEPATWRLLLPSDRYKPIIKVEFEVRDIAANSGVVMDHFDAYAVHIYHLTYTSQA
jgi:hypothetical protein